MKELDFPAERAEQRLYDIWSFVAAAVLAAFYLATTVYISYHRLLWWDELFTVNIARLPHWTTIWAALAHAVDSMPPIYYMVVRMFDKLFGYGEVAVRLPSSLAMVAGMLITFDCARRLTDGLHGLVAFSVLTCSFLPYYGYEARPYAICFMLAALALWVWTCTRGDRRWPAIFFGAIFFLGVTFHYYFVLYLVPYALWETTRWRPWHPLSRKLIAGIVGGVVPAALLSPLILSFSHFFPAWFWGRPSLWLIGKTFSDLFPSGLLLLALIMVWIVFVSGEGKRVVLGSVQPSEAVGWLSLCIPLAGFVAAELTTSAFTARYYIGALPGIAVAVSCCLWRHFSVEYRVTLGIFLLLASAGVAKQMTGVRDPESVNMNRSQTLTRQYMNVEDSLRQDGKRFILVPGGMSLESEYYLERPEEHILVLRTSPQGSWARKFGSNLAQYFPLHYWELDDLKRHARETALLMPTSQTLDAMKQSGFKVEVRFSEPMEVVYLQ